MVTLVPYFRSNKRIMIESPLMAGKRARHLMDKQMAKKTMRKISLGAALGAMILAAGTVHGVAQTATAPAASDKPDPASPWVKICNTDPKSKKEICLVTLELRTDTGQFLASVALREISGEARKTMIIAVPPGMLILPGLRVQIDKSKQKEAKYTICFPNACYAELVINKDFIAQLKRGNAMQLTTLNQQAKPVPFKLTLAGFTKTYDSAGMKPDELRAQNEKLQKELQKRAENARKKLIDKQREEVNKAE